MICCGAPRLGFSFVDIKAKRDQVAPTIARNVGYGVRYILVVEIIKAVDDVGIIAFWEERRPDCCIWER